MKASVNMFQNEIVASEFKRIFMLIGTDGGRNVFYDIELLKKAVEKLNDELINGIKSHVTIYCNMWEECHNSLDLILNEFDLCIDEKRSQFDDYQWCVTKKNGKNK